MLSDTVVMIRGAGEVASAVAHRLACSHFKVCLTEIPQPQAVSRGVSFCEAVYDGEKEVEGVVARLISSVEEIRPAWHQNILPLIIDPEATVIARLHPDVLVDAIMAKKNMGTKISDATLVIGLGPGFYAGRDVHVVVETNSSEYLGKVILNGEAEPNTGVPLEIGGFGDLRVLHSQITGTFYSVKKLGDLVSDGDTIALVGDYEVRAGIAGTLRAVLHDGLEVNRHTKLGEIDPIGGIEVCYSIRARMRAIAGGVLEAILMRLNV